MSKKMRYALLVGIAAVLLSPVRMWSGVTSGVAYDPFGPCVVNVQVSPFWHVASHCD
jgi:hypothetical protein